MFSRLSHPYKIHSVDGQELDLSYFVEWRPYLWMPAVTWLLGETSRFKNKRLLEIGCRYGRMSCLFGLLGATVLGVDLSADALEFAEKEAELWQVQNNVKFAVYDGNPLNIADENYDFIFSKSVLVVVPQHDEFLSGIACKLVPGGELMAVENSAGNLVLNWIRHHFIHRHWVDYEKQFTGVDDKFLQAFTPTFECIEKKDFYSLVTAIRAFKK